MDRVTTAAGRISRPNLPLLLLKTRESVIQPFRPIFHRFGLTEQQWRVLRLLADEAEMEQREVAQACRILGPSLAGILARLEEAGLVRRERASADQRRVFVTLSGKGKRLIAEMAPLVDAQYEKLEAALGRELMASLIAVLDRLLQLPAESSNGEVAHAHTATQIDSVFK